MRWPIGGSDFAEMVDKHLDFFAELGDEYMQHQGKYDAQNLDMDYGVCCFSFHGKQVYVLPGLAVPAQRD